MTVGSITVKLLDLVSQVAAALDHQPLKLMVIDADKEWEDRERFQRDALLGLAEWKIQCDALRLELDDTKKWLALREKQLAQCTRAMRLAADIWSESDREPVIEIEDSPGMFERVSEFLKRVRATAGLDK